MPSAFEVLAKDHQEVKLMLAELERAPAASAAAGWTSWRRKTGSSKPCSPSSPGRDASTSRSRRRPSGRGCAPCCPPSKRTTSGASWSRARTPHRPGRIPTPRPRPGCSRPQARQSRPLTGCGTPPPAATSNPKAGSRPARAWPQARARCLPPDDPGSGSAGPPGQSEVRYRGARPRKAASRSLGPAAAPTATGAANRGCRPALGTSAGAISSRLLARARGIGWRRPHALDMSHPWTAISSAAAAAMTPAASGQPAISVTWCW